MRSTSVSLVTVYVWTVVFWSHDWCLFSSAVAPDSVKHLPADQPAANQNGSLGCPLPSSELQERALVASPSEEHINISSQVAFACLNDTWTRTGPSYVICLPNGQWDRELPFCQYVLCPDLEPILHGDHEYQYVDETRALKPGVVAHHSCEAGYAFSTKGSPTRTCLANSTWSGQQPQCNGECGELEKPAGGHIAYDCMVEHCTAQVGCQMGYSMARDAVHILVCQADGSWSASVPLCSKTLCSAPSEVKHATADPDIKVKAEYGTNVTFTCDEGYSLEGSALITCSLAGKWVPSPPVCKPNKELVSLNTTNSTPKPACALPEPLANGTYRLEGKQVVYTCDEGFSLTGPHQRRCRDNSTWSGAMPTCVALEVTSTDRPLLWKQVFLDNRHWEGSYLFDGNPYEFHLYVSADSANSGQLSAHFIGGAGAASFDLKVSGARTGSNQVYLRMSRLLKPGERFPSTEWWVRGKLTMLDTGWVYEGQVSSPLKGFSTLSMTPFLPATGHAHPGPDQTVASNVTALGLGITIAVIAILMAALLAAFCVRRKVGLSAFGHRTLATSFENPVYEYENSALK